MLCSKLLLHISASFLPPGNCREASTPPSHRFSHRKAGWNRWQKLNATLYWETERFSIYGFHYGQRHYFSAPESEPIESDKS